MEKEKSSLKRKISGNDDSSKRNRLDASEDNTPGPRVLLSVSSLAYYKYEGFMNLPFGFREEDITERQLELNWFDAPPGMNEDPTSWVGLFGHDPAEGFSHPLEKAYTSAHSDGYYRTKIPFPRIKFSDKNLDDCCLGYWIGYITMDRLLAKSCIRARPHWMHEMRDIIGNQTLKDIMIPGTHNSGSYEPYGPQSNSQITRYQICQEEDIFNQLVYGNRFLDLRVMPREVTGSEEIFWITHGPCPTLNTLRDVLSQVKRFLDNTNEIVIIDFHKFEESISDCFLWNETTHKLMIHLLEKTLGNYMMPAAFEYSATLNDIWNSNKRLLVGYESDQRIQSNLLYPGITHLHGDKITKEELEKFLDMKMCRFTDKGLWSAMAELTATTIGVIFDTLGGLREMAQEVNVHITRWFRQRWWQCANIVATDFFLGNNIIDVAIESNARRFTNIRQ